MLSHITISNYIKPLSKCALEISDIIKIMWKKFSAGKGCDKKKSRPGPEAAHVGIVLITHQ